MRFAPYLIHRAAPGTRKQKGHRAKCSATCIFNGAGNSTLISSAQAVTKQRLALMDESILGATGSWLVSDYGNPVDATFGAGREAANTSANIVAL